MLKLGWAALLVFVACASRAEPPRDAQDRSVGAARPAVDASPIHEPATGELLPAASSQPVAPATPEPQPPPQQTPDPAPGVAEAGPTAAEARECSARGGAIQPVCMSGGLTCVVRYRDGGKRCSDKRDCMGACLYEGSGPAPTTAVGSCQRTNDPCGCKAQIRHGRVEPTVCVD